MTNKFNHDTKIIGVMGHPIKHSYSPLMHNLSFELAGLDYIYLPFDVPTTGLNDALKGMTALGIKGFNITIPHKEKIAQYLTDVSEEANVIGAVNTIVNDNGILHGYNTDVDGIIATLNDYKDIITDSEVSVIGAGGAARSVIYTLIRNFKVRKINIVNRTYEKAESVKEYFSTKMLFDKIKTYELVPPDVTKVFKNSKLIINTSAIGMFPNEDDAPTMIGESFNSKQIVFDVVYNPVKTKFLTLAEEQGATVLDGLTMFVEQGASSYELWTGEKMPVEKIYSTLKTYLEN